jgi:hypothetical protein
VGHRREELRLGALPRLGVDARRLEPRDALAQGVDGAHERPAHATELVVVRVERR